MRESATSGCANSVVGVDGVSGSKHVALRNDAFRAYADYMETPAFLAGIEELLLARKVRAGRP